MHFDCSSTRLSHVTVSCCTELKRDSSLRGEKNARMKAFQSIIHWVFGKLTYATATCPLLSKLKFLSKKKGQKTFSHQSCQTHSVEHFLQRRPTTCREHSSRWRRRRRPLPPRGTNPITGHMSRIRAIMALLRFFLAAFEWKWNASSLEKRKSRTYWFENEYEDFFLFAVASDKSYSWTDWRTVVGIVFWDKSCFWTYTSKCFIRLLLVIRTSYCT